MTQKTQDITIIGGGFAGLAAGLALEKQGAKIQIVEKRPFYGGRAYSFAEPKTGAKVDNGQHLLMGCYRETFKFLQDLGTLDQLDFQKGLEVSFADSAENFTQLKCPNLPAPFHLAWGLLGFKGLGLKDKWAMNRVIQVAKKSTANGRSWDQKSVQDLMTQTNQTEQAVKVFWEPIGLATLNEPLEIASAELFLEVLRQGLLRTKEDSRLALPKVGFSELYAKPAEIYFKKKNIPQFFQSQIAKIENTGGKWTLHTQKGETLSSHKILFAIPPQALKQILNNSKISLNGLDGELHRFKSSPIVSINLWFKKFRPKETFLGIIDSPLHWLFNKAKIFGEDKAPYLSLVISGAYDLAAKSKEELVELSLKELARYYPAMDGEKPYHAQVIKELEATYSGRMGLCPFRPAAVTNVDSLFLAGDWTSTGLPATIESAVLSGHLAANALMESEQ